MKRTSRMACAAALLLSFATVASCASSSSAPRVQQGNMTTSDAKSAGEPISALPTPTTAPTPPTSGAPIADSSGLVTDQQRCAALRTQAQANPARFAATSTFNTPAPCFAPHPESARWASTWFQYGNLPGRTDPKRRGEINVAFDAYSTPVYYTDKATTTINVYTAGWAWGHDLEGGRSIPWNPSWKPATGSDAEMVILDRASGKEWGLWGVQSTNVSECLTLENLFAGFRADSDLCVYSATVGRNPDGSIANATTSSGFAKTGGRGMGAVLGMALLPTLDEIERGSINHAVNMETYATMFGPSCSAGQISAGVAGSECGYAVAPATRHEWTSKAPECGASSMPFTTASRQQTVPEGTRFALNKTDEQIDAWLTSRGYTGKRRSTARIFAVAMRDYGWVVSDTTCWSSSMAVEGVANPDARQRWAQLGITNPSEDGGSLLVGLIGSANDVTVLSPPSNTLITKAH